MDLGDFGALINPTDPGLEWHDHGVGLLRTILHQAGVMTEIASTRNCESWGEVAMALYGFDMLLMNVRSYNFPIAHQTARLYKSINPRGICIVGGMHATVSVKEMEACPEFDKICQGGGEKIIVDLVRNPEEFPRVVKGPNAASLAEWPTIDRRLWPEPGPRFRHPRYWPLEGTIGWGPAPVASVISNRVCPWACVFCSENSFIPNMGRRPVDMLIDELNELDKNYGPLGSVVIHDSMFFQQPKWLKEWIEKYPKRANKVWPYWASARADTVRKWPDLFEALVRETNWHSISIGFESGSTRVLKMLNKECTAEDNYFAIDLLNRIGDDIERQGRKRPFFWFNLMYAIPGETPEDAFESQRMLRFCKRPMVSPSYYAPYPGAVLGHQIIAEGKSLMGQNHERYIGNACIKGVDYQFYADLQAGRYEAQIVSKLWAPCYTHGKGGEGLAQEMYLYDLKNGKKRVAYGVNPQDALDILSQRMTPLEMAEIVPDSHMRISQKTVRQYIDQLG